ncbi:hypothetical protein O181_019258 [Austropuccinia psidii MF-1]|uniref:Integrase catalytic domain-containing protein n=1 Tax=Austropuccinia psidii MF-1 TaxID=1389203 RepID=A0A9Q3GTF2_9BASI|nr:hypothetical protein [Austropuccinia psidii MF-1]
MSNKKYDLDDLRAALFNSTTQSGAHFRQQVEIDRLGEGITPRLTSDGMNFHHWAKSLTRLVERTHGVKDYFGTQDNNPGSERNAEIRTYIKKSVAVDLNNSIKEEDEARKVYHLLKNQFEKPSWSHVMNLVDDLINAPEASKNLNEAFATTKSTVSNLRSAIGSAWTDEAITAMFFHLRNKKHFHQISTALDSKLSLEATYKIKAGDILHIAQQFQKRRTEPSYDHSPSLMAASGSASPQHFRRQSVAPRDKQPSTRILIGQQSESWAQYHLSPRFPCLHCFEWGHWVQDCKWNKAGLPAIKDPRKKNPNAVLKKSSVFSHPCIAEVEMDDGEPLLSSIQETPGDTSLVLLDSGATHHVTGNATLFTEYKKVDLTLSVASARQHPVVGKGIINLACPSGDLKLTEVLHCPNIPETVLSIGKFVRNDGEVKFEGGLFKLIQNSCTHYSSLKGDRWFLCLNNKLFCNAISDYSKDVSRLLHRRLAHLSLRTVSACARGRGGDGSHGAFLSLNGQEEAANFITEWIEKFNNLTKYSVKRLRSDNGGEFSSQHLKEYLDRKGIIDERTIPYKHHQAGKIKRTNQTIAEAARSMDLTPKARELIHIGIAKDGKGWLFWDNTRKQLVKGASAVFDENKGQPTDGRVPGVSTIQIQNIFDTSMIKEIGYQDEQVELMNVSASLHSDAPDSYKEALASNEKQEWKEAILAEIASMGKMKVWTEVPKNAASSVLGTRWVFTVKRDPAGKIT